MVNSGSFDSADVNRNGKTRCTQAIDAALGSQSSDSDDSKCKGGCSKSADGDLPSDESAIEPTPTKTEINSSILPLPSENEKFSTASYSLPPPPPPPASAISSDQERKTKQTRKLLCLYCDRSFASANLRQKHVERVHSVKSTRRVSARRQNSLSSTPCVHCDKLNTSEHTLNDLFQHLVEEHSARYFGCLACEERFLTMVHLKDHNKSKHFSAEPVSPGLHSELDKYSGRSRLQNTAYDEENRAKLGKKPKIKELKNKKISVKTSKIATKRSKRLQQQQAKEQEAQKKRREKKPLSMAKPEGVDRSKIACVNPYPEFDSFYRVKKITDHSIDNLKISSLTFDDVFDKAFFNRIKCNIEENLLHHIDGKLFKNEESETRISNFEKISTVPHDVQNPNDNYGCEISLNAITPAPSLSLSSQFGEDFEAQIEYGSKPSKKKTQIKSDEVHYKYFTRRKYQASILQQKENRDLSKLDMWTQMVVKERQERILNTQKSAKEIQEYTCGQEYKSKMKRQELNRILDRRGPFEDLKEEASKKAAFDKLNSSSENDVSQEVFTDVREILDELLNKVFEAAAEDDSPLHASSPEIDRRVVPMHLDLRRKTSSTQEEIDKSDRIALICSSQETENFELPTNPVRGKNELTELTGEWARSRMYICAACGGKFSNMKYLLEHKSLYHQNVWVQHYEFVGNQSELYRHLSIPGLGKVGIVEETVPCKLWKRSDARTCTKCGKQCNSLGELHRHVLECGGDWTWMVARKKCKYKPFGAKARRKRRGFEPRIPTKRKTEPSEKKIYKKPLDGPRQRPSDADTIQRMLANLPAKRSRRSLISLTDVVFKSRKPNNMKGAKSRPAAKRKCGKVIHNKQQLEPNQPRTSRALRSLNKVLSSRILDLNSSLLVKRKMKAMRSQRLTRNAIQGHVEEDLEAATSQIEKPRKSPKQELKIISGKPANSKPTGKRLLSSRLSLKNFFPIKKKGIRSVDKVADPVKALEEHSDPKYLENFEHSKKNKRGGLKGFVRALSLRKRSSKQDCLAATDVKNTSDPVKKSNRLKAKRLSPSEVPEPLVLSKKRKFQRSICSVLNRVKKIKTDKSLSSDDSKKEIQPFLEEAKDNAQEIEGRGAPIAAMDLTENPTVPETIFNLTNKEEKNLQAKGVELEEADKIDSKTTPVAVDTSLKPMSCPMTSPTMKGKIRKPSRGLNDCIAMLTSKLQRKEEKTSSLESLFSTSSTTSVDHRTENRPLLDVLKPTEAEETALDLSKKSVSTPNLCEANGASTWTSVDDIIQEVIQNSACLADEPLLRTNVDDTIDSVVNTSLNWFENSKHHKKLKKKKRSDDDLITNILFGKDKLIIAPSSNPKKDFEDPLIAKIKENEYKMSQNSRTENVQIVPNNLIEQLSPMFMMMIDNVAPPPCPESRPLDLDFKTPFSNKKRRSKRQAQLRQSPTETNLENEASFQQPPNEGAAELAKTIEPVRPPMDSDDEIPLAVIAKLDEAKLPETIEELEEAKDMVDSVTTDSLKENVEQSVGKPALDEPSTEAKKKKRRLKNKKRNARESSIVSGESKAFDFSSPEAKGEQLEAPKAPINQRTRRKSKSSKKVEKTDNDLFKDFSLVINKKTKRIPPTSIVDDSVCEDILDMAVRPKTPLNDSVEEMDMEIEDIPVNSSIIERGAVDNQDFDNSTENSTPGKCPEEAESPEPILGGAPLENSAICDETKSRPDALSIFNDLVEPTKSEEEDLNPAEPPKTEESSHFQEPSEAAASANHSELNSEISEEVAPLQTGIELTGTERLLEDSGFVEKFFEESDKVVSSKPTDVGPQKASKGKNVRDKPKRKSPKQSEILPNNLEEEKPDLIEPRRSNRSKFGASDSIIPNCEEALPRLVDSCKELDILTEITTKSRRPRKVINYNEDKLEQRAMEVSEDSLKKNRRPKKEESIENLNPDLEDALVFNVSKETEKYNGNVEPLVYKISDFSEIPKLVVDIHHMEQIDQKLKEQGFENDEPKDCAVPPEEDSPVVKISEEIEDEPSLEVASKDLEDELVDQLNTSEKISEASEGLEAKDNEDITKTDPTKDVFDFEESVSDDETVPWSFRKEKPPVPEDVEVKHDLEGPEDSGSLKKAKKKNNMDIDIANILDTDSDVTSRRSPRIRQSVPGPAASKAIKNIVFENDAKRDDVIEADNFVLYPDILQKYSSDSNKSLPILETTNVDDGGSTDLVKDSFISAKTSEGSCNDALEDAERPDGSPCSSQLSKINIKDLLLSSLAPPGSTYMEEAQKSLKPKKKQKPKKSKQSEKNNKSALGKDLSFTTLKNVLSTFTKKSDDVFSEIITSSEMDIAPVLDEIDKSLESDDVYDYPDSPATLEAAKSKPKRPAKVRTQEAESQEVGDLKASDGCGENTSDCEGLELRRSRRGSRKVASYNENDLIDPLIDALENRRNRSARKDKKVEPPQGPPKLSSEQLFDILKNSSFENENGALPKPSLFYSFNESQSNPDPHKIYEFTEDSPESTEAFGKTKKKPPSVGSQDPIEPDKPNYCDICKKTFIRVENLVKHKMTLTHISKLSELEAKEAEEKAKLERKTLEEQAPPARDEINLTDILQQPERPLASVQEQEPLPLHESHSLKLVDIISDVLNKPVLENYIPPSPQDQDKAKGDVRRYKSLGERKSFESETHLAQMNPSLLTQTKILENQINLLENIIENNLENIASNNQEKEGGCYMEEMSSCSSSSCATSGTGQDFVKPPQFEEISEDSASAKISEDQKQRKTLNRDEELFLECCSLLKSGSELSNSKKPRDVEDKSLKQTAEEAHEYSDNSRTPTPLGDTYDDDASNSNTISSNWHLGAETHQNLSLSFEEVKNKEAACMSFGEMLTKGLKNQFESPVKLGDSFQTSGDDRSDSSTKIATKGARKVYEGLKVSIPTEDLNLDVLNSRKNEASAQAKPRSTRKSKPVKKSQVGINLLFKSSKKKSSAQPGNSPEKQDIYNFEDTQDNPDVFIKPAFKSSKSDNESLSYADSIGADANSISSVSSISALSAKKPEIPPENITKKKYKIMGIIFKNAAKSKIDEIDEELRSIPEIPEMDNIELVENYVRSCQRVKSPFLPPPPPPPLDEVPKKPKMTEEEMDMLFDQLLGKPSSEPKPKANKTKPRPKNSKVKCRKRPRANSESSDDEFNISRTTKKRTNKKNNQEESGINLELELKECIGVASRKSQRTCTSGKQNILVEYWSSDEEAFEAMLESHKTPKEPDQNKPEIELAKPKQEAFEKPAKPAKKKAQPMKKPKEIIKASPTVTNRRKRAAANPLYHWSSSSEDESQSLIEVKPVREEDDEDDRPIQHGWIVGDSPKKLVTMLALTKGKKTDIDSVKEQSKRRTSNTVS